MPITTPNFRSSTHNFIHSCLIYGVSKATVAATDLLFAPSRFICISVGGGGSSGVRRLPPPPPLIRQNEVPKGPSFYACSGTRSTIHTKDPSFKYPGFRPDMCQLVAQDLLISCFKHILLEERDWKWHTIYY